MRKNLAGWLGGLLLVAGVLTGMVACGPVDDVEQFRELQNQLDAKARRVFSVVGVPVDSVARVTVEHGSSRVQLIRSEGGLWAPGKGATPQIAALMFEAESSVLPLRAYRRFSVEHFDPAYGLDAPTITFTVESSAGRRFVVRLGEATPTRGGYYAQLDGDPRVYAVIAQAYKDLLSVATGVRFFDPLPQEVIDAFEDVVATEDPEEVTNPWLGQILDVERGHAVPPDEGDPSAYSHG